jgi:GntR family transcriptional regulator/MocR family aminotransferase
VRGSERSITNTELNVVRRVSWYPMVRPRWEFGLAIDRQPDRPLFLQIANAIADDICRGRLRAGDPLPGTRTLAQSLEVNRVTVLTAYEELAAQGWIVTERAKGARVSGEIPEPSSALAARARPGRGLPAATYTLQPAPPIERWPHPRPGVLVMNSWPDTRLVRTESLARAYRRVLRRHGRRLLAYGDPLGHPSLRRAVAQMLSTSRAVSIGADDVMITRGSQMALYLLARAAITPRAVIAVEAIGYPYAWRCFRDAGGTMVPVPVDREGLDVTALAAIAASRRVAAVYVTPHHQFPTTVTMSASRRAQLLELARQHRMLVIEDDYDDAFHYDGRPVMPLASLDRAGVVAYIGTFSKVFAPGLRMGYLVAPRPVLEQLTVRRELLDIHGDAALEAAIAELLDEGEVQRHIRRVKRIYKRRRDLLVALLRNLPTQPVTFDVPAGGVALWIRAAAGIDIDEWAHASAARGVRFMTARSFAFDRRRHPFARLGFASVNEAEIAAAVERLAEALAALPPRAGKDSRRHSTG